MWIVPGNSHGVHLSHTEDDDAIRVYPVTNDQCVLFIVDTIKSSVNRSRPGLRRRPRQTSRCVDVNDHNPDQQAPGKGIDYFRSLVQKPRAPKLCVSPIGVYHLIDTRFGSHRGHYVNSPARELHRQRAKSARAVADQINLRCKSKSAAGRQQFVRRTTRSGKTVYLPAHATRHSWQVARRSAQNSREQVILEEIQCRRRSNVQPDAQRAGYGYQQVGSAVPVAD